MTRPFRECDYFTCARCGRRITRGGNRRDTLACRDCQTADPYAVARLIGEPPPPPPDMGAPLKRVLKGKTRDQWTDQELGKAANQYRKKGMRDPWTIEGNREYQRRKVARQRAQKAARQDQEREAS